MSYFFAVARLRSSARCQNSRSSLPKKGAKSASEKQCLRMAVALVARSCSGDMGTHISMSFTSHSAHAPRYIQMRQSSSHSAPACCSRSMAASHGVGALAVSAVRVGEVAGHEDLVGLDLSWSRLAHDLHVTSSPIGILLHPA